MEIPEVLANKFDGASDMQEEESKIRESKIDSLATAMTTKKRADETEFYCFSDSAPEELKDLFLKHYEVRDIDYRIFSSACDILIDIYPIEQEEDINEQIHEAVNDTASVYTSDRLELLNIWNQDEISSYVKDMDFDIATACAYWFEEQVKDACFIISNWVNDNQ